MILFLQNSDVRTLYTQTKEVEIPKNKKINARKWKNQVELTTVSVLYRRMLGVWAIIDHYQISFVKFARKHVYIFFFAELAAW